MKALCGLAFALIIAIALPSGMIEAEEIEKTNGIDLSGNEKLIRMNIEYQKLRLEHDQKMTYFLHQLNENDKKASKIADFIEEKNRNNNGGGPSYADMHVIYALVIEFFYETSQLTKFFYETEAERERLYKKLDELEAEVHAHVQEKIVKDILQ